MNNPEEIIDIAQFRGQLLEAIERECGLRPNSVECGPFTLSGRESLPDFYPLGNDMDQKKETPPMSFILSDSEGESQK